jgi:hypothetical protein
MEIGDLIRAKKHGTLGVVIGVVEASQVDDQFLKVIWINSGNRGGVFWDEVEVLSEAR